MNRQKVIVSMKDGGTSLGNRIANQFVNTTQLPFNSARNSFMTPPIEVKNTLQPTSREESSVEAERGETVVTNFMKDGIPEHYVIGGKRHYAGGTPLNLPENSFIFSRDKKLSIKDPDILDLFGKKSKKGFTPADIAKQYKLNDYRKVLADPDTSELQRTTAERMITNYNNKLGALAMAQESIKGFPDGIPAIAMGYLGNIGIDPSQLVQMPGQPQAQGMSVQGQPMRFGGQSKPQFMKFGGTVKMQKGGPVNRRKVLVSYQEGGTPKVGESQDEYNARTTGNYTNSFITYIWDGKDWVKDGAPATNNGDFNKGTTTVPSTTGTSTKTQNIPSGSVKWDVTLDGYDETQIQQGDYIKKADGKWYKVNGYKEAPYTYNYEDSRLSGTAGDTQEAYGRLEQMMLDPNNSAFRTDLIAQHRTNLQNTKPNSKTGLTQADIDKAAAMSDEEIINNFLEMQKQVFAVNASGIGGREMDESDSWDKSRDNYVSTVSNLGFTPLEPWQQAAFQSTYIGLNTLANGSDHKNLLGDFRMAQEGRDDESVSGLRTGSISQIDGWVGNTTIAQSALYKPVLKDLDMAEVDYTEAESKVTPTLDNPHQQDPNAPWWLQDIVKTAGAAGDQMRIKKYSPWQASPEVYLPDPTFFDPTRQLAANAEQMNIGTQGASVFSGPQAFNARYSQIQGQGAQNAANILGQVENQNVQVANQFEQNKAQILNQHSLNKSNLATQLYDKNVIANQQFDNSKAQARQMVRQSYIDAITNRGQTQALNELYPQYRVDPSTGGFLDFTKGRDVNPSNVNTTSFMDTFQEYKNMNPGVSDEVLYKMVNADMGMPDSTPAQVDPSYYANYMNGMPQ